MAESSSRGPGGTARGAPQYRAPQSVPWGVLEGVALLAAFQVLSPVVAAAFVLRWPEPQREVVATLLSDVAILLAVVVLVGRWAGGRREGLGALGLRIPPLGDVLRAWPVLAAGAVAYLAVAHASATVAHLVGAEWQIQRVAEAVRAARYPGELAVVALVAVVVAPLAEEVVFRGAFYLPLRSLLGPVGAAVIVSLVFSAAHMYPWGAGNLVVLSIVFIALFEHTGSLWAPIVAHALYNAGNFVIIRFVLPAA